MYLDNTASMCAGSVSNTRFDRCGRAFSSCFCVDGVGFAPAMMGTSLGLAVGLAWCKEGMAQAATMNGRNDVVQTICRETAVKYGGLGREGTAQNKCAAEEWSQP